MISVVQGEASVAIKDSSLSGIEIDRGVVKLRIVQILRGTRSEYDAAQEDSTCYSHHLRGWSVVQKD